MKKALKSSLTILGVICSVLLVGSLIGVSIWALMRSFSNNENKDENGRVIKESQKPNTSKYISERSFSLRASLDDGTSVFGTGWLMAEDKDGVSYYIATNMHVASAIQNSGKTYYESILGFNNRKIHTSLGKNVLNPRFNVLSIGNVYDGGNYWTTKINNKIGDTIYHTHFNDYDNAVKVVYTPTDYFKKEQNILLDTSNGKFKIENPTIDFAVIKINTSYAKHSIPSDKEILKGIITNYKKNPTTFGKIEHPKKNSRLSLTHVSIGGYPFKINNTTEIGKGKWDSLIDVQLSTYYSPFYGASFDSNYYPQVVNSLLNQYNSWSSDTNNIKNDFYQSVLIPNNVHYQTNEFAGYKNVGAQLIFNEKYEENNTNEPILSGGASGSMVVNDNNQVIGIYWGAYTIDGSEYGVFDLLVNEFSAEQSYMSKPYNVIDDFIQKNPSAIVNKTF